MSFNIVLNTNNAYSTNTAGKDYTWAFDFTTFPILDGDYELTHCAFSRNVTQATFDTIGNPQINLDISNQPRIYMADNVSNNHTTQIIGIFKPIIVSATVGTFQNEYHTNPPVTFTNINKSVNFIRVYMTQAGTNTLITTSIVGWTMILRFKKV